MSTRLGPQLPRRSILSGCVCEGVSDELPIPIPGLLKTDHPSQCGQAPFNPLGIWIKQKVKKEDIHLLCFLHACWAGTSIFPCLIYLIRSPGSQAFRQKLELHHQLARVSSLQTRQQSVGLLKLHNCASQFIYIFYWYCLPGNPIIHTYTSQKSWISKQGSVRWVAAYYNHRHRHRY